ncbi:hypothetical protein QAD02_007217 [Eretmocerus hayati]|uniref:Uncharacterized protein n=1 Tax=Eretmocerus hayati TaxID=131215 RepID=A0ACC2N312_9HYME|nr:hypothetical protein QAD02_007217 [Eretmocerus hayati]
MVGIDVYSECKSSTLITSLNHIGVSVSYDEVKRCRTGLAAHTMDSCQDEVSLPSNFDPEEYTLVAVDTLDELEATMSGLDLSHDSVVVAFRNRTDRDVYKPNVSATNIDRKARAIRKQLPCQRILDFEEPLGDIQPPSDMVNSTIPITEESLDEILVDVLAWLHCRMNVEYETRIPSVQSNQTTSVWDATQALLLDDNRPVRRVGYLPTLVAPITEYQTVCTILKNCKSILSQLKQNYLPLFCDEGVYHIVRYITLVIDEFNDIPTFLGIFHMLKVVQKCIGEYLEESVFEHLFVETSTFGERVAEQVLEGTNYVRSTKGFLLLGEVLQRLQIEAFFNEQGTDPFQDELSLIQTLQQTLSEANKHERRILYRDSKGQLGSF